MAAGEFITVINAEGEQTLRPLDDVLTSTTESVFRDFSCSASEVVGDAVYVSGADTVAKANAASSATTPAIGLIIDKPTTTTCRVVLYGECSVLSGLIPGNIYYLSTTPGVLTNVPPTAGHTSAVQQVGIASSSSILVVQPMMVAASDEITETAIFQFNSSSPFVLVQLKAGDRISDVEVSIEAAFDDPAATLSLGTVGNPSLVFPTGNLPPTIVGTYLNEENFLIGLAETLTLFLSPGASTVGSGRVTYSVRR